MSDMQNNESRKQIKGVFSTQAALKIGEGVTQRKVDNIVYYYTEEREDGVLELQALNANYVPSGRIIRIDVDTLRKQYAPEVEMYLNKTLPALKELTRLLAKAERLRQRGEPYSAEFEFLNALKMDANNVRGNFGLGLVYLDRGEKEKANEVFQKLVNLDETFHKSNKHLFNEFGIQLRKSKMFNQALKYYGNAFLLDNKDENLLYNMARVLYDRGDFNDALAKLDKALELRPDFTEAKDLREVLACKVNRAASGSKS